MGSSTEYFIAADIGGTNTRFILCTADGSETENHIVFQEKYHNHEFETFELVLRQFLAESGVKHLPKTACFAVAGPVKNNAVRFTNRDSWVIVGEEVSKAVGISKVVLVNDFVAAGYGLLTLNHDKECVVLQQGVKNPRAPIACIGAGTGLGECFLTPDSATGVYHCYPTEGGHAEFAPRNELEFNLLQFLKEKFKQKHRVSVERIISGPGLANIYEYLAHAFPEKVNQELHAKIENSGDFKGEAIATNQSDPLCRQTMEIFVTAYGAEAGVAGLKWLPYGGLYLTGGLTPKNLQLLSASDGPFLQAFHDKGRVSGMLQDIPIFAVMAEDLGERGACYVAKKLLLENKPSLIAKVAQEIKACATCTVASCPGCWNHRALLAGASVGVGLLFALAYLRVKNH